MAKRVFDTLGAMDDARRCRARRGDPRTIGHGAATPRRRALARRLFARALETPGGLKVQTIHAFCTQLLHQFPFEANVAARFTVLDETEQTQLLEQLTLARAARRRRARPTARSAARSAVAMTAAADQTFRDVVRAAIGRRDAISRWVDRCRRRCRRRSPRCRARSASIRPTTATASKRSSLPAPRLRPRNGPRSPRPWRKAARPMPSRRAASACCASLPRADRVETYLEIFCTSDDRTPRKSIVTKAIKDAGLVERLRAEQDRVCALLERRRAVVCRDRTAALLTVAHEVLTRYQQRERAPRPARLRRPDRQDAGAADQRRRGLGALQARSRHRSRADRRGAGHQPASNGRSSGGWSPNSPPARARAAVTRTMFAVGDEKQSIYSFQNAAPKEFAEMRRYFRSAPIRAAESKFDLRQVRAFVPLRRERARRRRRGVQGELDRGERLLG